MLYLGIDLHSKQLTVSCRNESGDEVLRRQVSTRPQAVDQFLSQISGLAAADGGWVAILEVCGFSDWLVDRLQTSDCRDVLLVQPTERARQKTDRRDAAKLSSALWVNRLRLLAGRHVQGLRRVAIATPQERADRQLTALRREAGQWRTQIVNRIRHLLARRNLSHQFPTRSLRTIRGRRWLRELQLEPLDRMELDQALEQLQVCETQWEQLAEQIRRRHNASDRSMILGSIPGCGAFTALAIAARIGDVRRFPAPRSLANYFGLVPRCRNSGENTQRLGSITKQGSPLVRFLLGQLVLHVLRRDAHMRAWYKKLKSRRGSKIARVAVMRRLATIIWHMLSKGEAYQPGGPPRRRLTMTSKC